MKKRTYMFTAILICSIPIIMNIVIIPEINEQDYKSMVANFENIQLEVYKIQYKSNLDNKSKLKIDAYFSSYQNYKERKLSLNITGLEKNEDKDILSAVDSELAKSSLLRKYNIIKHVVR